MRLLLAWAAFALACASVVRREGRGQGDHEAVNIDEAIASTGKEQVSRSAKEHRQARPFAKRPLAQRTRGKRPTSKVHRIHPPEVEAWAFLETGQETHRSQWSGEWSKRARPHQGEQDAQDETDIEELAQKEPKEEEEESSGDSQKEGSSETESGSEEDQAVEEPEGKEADAEEAKVEVQEEEDADTLHPEDAKSSSTGHESQNSKEAGSKDAEEAGAEESEEEDKTGAEAMMKQTDKELLKELVAAAKWPRQEVNASGRASSEDKAEAKAPKKLRKAERGDEPPQPGDEDYIPPPDGAPDPEKMSANLSKEIAQESADEGPAEADEKALRKVQEELREARRRAKEAEADLQTEKDWLARALQNQSHGHAPAARHHHRHRAVEQNARQTSQILTSETGELISKPSNSRRLKDQEPQDESEEGDDNNEKEGNEKEKKHARNQKRKHVNDEDEEQDDDDDRLEASESSGVEETDREAEEDEEASAGSADLLETQDAPHKRRTPGKAAQQKTRHGHQKHQTPKKHKKGGFHVYVEADGALLEQGSRAEH